MHRNRSLLSLQHISKLFARMQTRTWTLRYIALKNSLDMLLIKLLDVAEACNGSSEQCPPDAYLDASRIPITTNSLQIFDLQQICVQRC